MLILEPFLLSGKGFGQPSNLFARSVRSPKFSTLVFSTEVLAWAAHKYG